MEAFFSLTVLIEPDRLRFIRFAKEAVRTFGGPAFATGPRMVELLGLLRAYCNRADAVVTAQLALRGRELHACCGDHFLLLCTLPDVPDISLINVVSERLREQSETADPALLKQRNQQIKADLERSIRQAETDSLTGLFNRGAYDRRLGEAVLRCRRQGQSLSLVLLDLDHFKEVNDNHGHQYGDDYLRRMAEAMRQAARQDVDLLCRIGGDEFAIVVFSSVDVAESVAGRVLQLMDGRVSAGVAAMDADDSTERLVARADGALYAAKEGGRGQVCTDGRPAARADGASSARTVVS